VFFIFHSQEDDAQSRKKLLDDTILILNIWNQGELVYSYNGKIPFGLFGGRRLSKGKWMYGVPSEMLKIGGDYSLRRKINNKCVGSLHILSQNTIQDSSSENTLSLYIVEIPRK